MRPASPTGPSSALPAGAWTVVALLWIVALLNYLDRLLITSMREAIEASIPMTEAQFGLLTSVFLWVYAALSPLAGFIADRFSRKRVIIASLLFWSVFTWLTGHAGSFTTLFLARAGMGASEACYIPAGLALITDYHRGRTRSFAAGLHASGLYAGMALGGIGGYLALAFGWRLGFGLFGYIGLAYALVLAWWIHDVPVTRVEERAIAREGLWAAAAELFRYPGFAAYLVVNVIIGISNWLIYAWLPTFLEEHFHLGAGAAGVSATAYIQVAAFAGVVVGGKWTDHWAGSNPHARMLVPAVGYLLAAPALFLVASTPFLATAIGALLLFGLGKGFYDANMMPILRQVAHERHSATGYGIMNGTSSLLGGLMTYAGGALRDRHVPLGVVFEATAAALFLAGLLLVRVRSGPASRLPPAMAADASRETML